MRLKTARLELVPPHPKYAKELNSVILGSLHELSLTMPWANFRPSVQETSAVLEGHEREYLDGTALNFLLFRTDSRRLIGACGAPRSDLRVPKYELGYWLSSEEQGNGFMTEAVQMLTRYLFASKEAKRVEIRCDRENVASWKVAEKAGFILEATLENDRRNPMGRLTATQVYVRFS